MGIAGRIIEQGVLSNIYTGLVLYTHRVMVARKPAGLKKKKAFET